MTPALLVGYLAALLGTVCWIPQAWKALEHARHIGNIIALKYAFSNNSIALASLWTFGRRLAHHYRKYFRCPRGSHNRRSETKI